MRKVNTFFSPNETTESYSLPVTWSELRLLITAHQTMIGRAIWLAIGV